MAEKKVQAKARGEKTALLIIDVQNGMFGKATPVYREETLLANICVLRERARAAGILVVYLQHADKHWLVEGTDTWPIHPRVQPLPGDLVINKRHPNSFEDTPLETELEARGVGVLLVTGMVTHGCVKATCLGAQKLGYRVILVSDAHSNFHKDPEPLIAETEAKLKEAGVEVAEAGSLL